MAHIVKRGEWFHFNRRVPASIAHIDPRTFIQMSLKTRCPDTAATRAAVLNDHLEAYWSELLETGGDPEQARFKRHVKLAGLHGFKYRPTAQIAHADPAEITARIEAVQRSGRSRAAVEALLGVPEHSGLSLSECFEPFLEHSRPKILSKTDHQRRKWSEVRRATLNSLIGVIGDKPVCRLGREDILAYRAHWLDRMEHGGIAASTVNKHVCQYLKNILETLSAFEPGIELDIAVLFADLRIPERARERQPYSEAFIQTVLLDQEKLAGMNEDGRLLICALADTGARPREIITLQPDNICLDADIPHIRIRPTERETLKTFQSKRDIPLVGAALFAFQQRPDGFSRDHARQVDNFTSAVNKFLRENGLRESPDQTLYSLRHSFQDRLNAHEVGERMQCELMGHKFASRAKYGAGPSLEHKHRVLSEMAFAPPVVLPTE